MSRLRFIHWVTFAAVSILGISIPAALAAQRAIPRQLSLEEALGLATPASEAVAIAQTAIDRARGERLRARSELFPQLSGSFSYARQIKSQFEGLFGSPDPDPQPPGPSRCDAFVADPTLPVDERLAALEEAVACATTVNPFAGFGQLPFGRKNTYTLGLVASQTVFDGGRIFGQIKSAEAGRRSAELGLTSATARLLLDVVQAYYDAALADRLVIIAEATLAQADTTLYQTKLRREVGTSPEFDVLRASVARDNQRPQVIQARTRRDLAYVRLKQVLNLPRDEQLALTTELVDTTLSEVPTLARLASTVPDTVAANRAPVRQAAEAVRAQEGLDQAARAGRLPAISLSSQFSRIGYPVSGLPSWNEFLTDWRVSLAVQVPIFTGGRLKGERAVARAGLEEARLRHQQTVEAAELDTRNALAELEAAVANWQASEGTAAQATRAYQIADIRFGEGISTQTELLDARIALQQAESNRAQAARDLQVARVRVALLPSLPLADPTVVPQAPPRRETVPVRPQPQTPVTTTETIPTGQMQ